MVKKLSILAFVFVLISCGQKTKSTEEVTVEPQASETIISDGHSANVSLDYAGTYVGVLPCADCEGIEVTIVLDYEGNYTKKTRYLGKESTSIPDETGVFTWNEEGNTITLTGITDESNQYFVGENQITQLDFEGNKITSQFASNYILKKQ